MADDENNEEQASPPYWERVWASFWRFRTNRISTRVVYAMFAIGILAPLLANGFPLAMSLPVALPTLEDQKTAMFRERNKALEAQRNAALDAVDEGESDAFERLERAEDALSAARPDFDTNVWPGERAKILQASETTLRFPVMIDLCRPQRESAVLDYVYNAFLLGFLICIVPMLIWRFTRGPIGFRSKLQMMLVMEAVGAIVIFVGAGQTSSTYVDYYQISKLSEDEKVGWVLWPPIPYSYYGNPKGHILLPPPYLADPDTFVERAQAARLAKAAAEKQVAKLTGELERLRLAGAPEAITEAVADLSEARKRVKDEGDNIRSADNVARREQFALEVDAHLIGADANGRDVLSRLIHGTRIALSIGFIAVTIANLIGITLGACMGYFGGIFDFLGMRLLELMMGVPTFFLMLTIIALWPDVGIWGMMFVIGLTSWPGSARLIRGEFLRLRQLDYVSAAVALGSRPSRIMFRHLLPNALAPIMVSVPFGVVGAILAESGLSFLGIGLRPPVASWGEILSEGRAFFPDSSWLIWFPSLAIFVTVTCYTLVGQGFRDATDPRLNS
jgi:ABC-type dipeptide/oligopeptide/nickel transport system permease subunit